MERDALIDQMAKAFAGQSMMEPSTPREEMRRRAAEALIRVEIYLGADIDDAREMIGRVLEDVT